VINFNYLPLISSRKLYTFMLVVTVQILLIISLFRHNYALYIMLCILHMSYLSRCRPCPHTLPRERYTGWTDTIPKYGLSSDRLLNEGKKRVKEEHNFQMNSKKDGEIEV
jgi:hypothetical protein